MLNNVVTNRVDVRNTLFRLGTAPVANQRLVLVKVQGSRSVGPPNGSLLQELTSAAFVWPASAAGGVGVGIVAGVREGVSRQSRDQIACESLSNTSMHHSNVAAAACESASRADSRPHVSSFAVRRARSAIGSSATLCMNAPR